jgi:hypothetical protein
MQGKKLTGSTVFDFLLVEELNFVSYRQDSMGLLECGFVNLGSSAYSLVEHCLVAFVILQGCHQQAPLAL